MRSEEITVAIAACGRVASLERGVAALLGGTALPGELIVVDQSPSPEARGAVEDSGLLRARYVEQARLGVSAARNLALEQSARPVLAHTDDDCVPEPGWIAAIAAAFEPGEAVGALTGPILPLGDRPPGAHAVSLRTSSTRVDYAGRHLPWLPGSGGNLTASRELLRRIGGWDRRLGPGSPGCAAEDADLLYRILRAGETVRYEPDAIVRHEWQTWERRLATRESYGHGIGALCGIWLRRGDSFGLRMLAAYTRLHARELAVAARHRDPGPRSEHALALRGVLPGLTYGLRTRR